MFTIPAINKCKLSLLYICIWICLSWINFQERNVETAAIPSWAEEQPRNILIFFQAKTFVFLCLVKPLIHLVFIKGQPVSQVFYYYLFQFYKPSFCPLTNCVLAKLNKFNDFLTRKTQYMTTYEKYHEHIQVAKCYSLQIGLWTLDLKKGDLIILYQVKKEKPAELLAQKDEVFSYPQQRFYVCRL